MTKRIKVLQLCAIDVTARFLLLPLIRRLDAEGYEVHVASSPGEHLDFIAKLGFTTHPLRIDRAFISFRHPVSVVRLASLMRRERFDAVHVHTPVAAALGRIAAELARVPVVIYTAHGFYFHDLMPRWKRRPIIWVERLLGRCCTDLLFTVSCEDEKTAVRERIMERSRVICLNSIGVDLRSFGVPPDQDLREELSLKEEEKIVGFIGRLVREKGIEELLRAMGKVVREIPEAKLLVVGDTLRSDRDRRAKERLRRIIGENGLEGSIVFAGYREDVPALLSIIDLFVLPSYREGMPRTIIEAMAAGKPVVATDIRGCREEVVDGETGLLVPVRDPDALAEAIMRILADDDLARRMGEAGRKRAKDEFDEQAVLDRQIDAYKRALEQALKS